MPQRISTITNGEFYKMLSHEYQVPIARRIIRPSERPGVSPREDRILYRAAKSIRPKIILEIGTNYGNLTLGLFINAFYAFLYTIDIYKGMKIDVPASQKIQVLSKNEVGRAFRGKIPGIYQILGDSRDADTYARLEGKAVDLAFIDGNHSFDAVVRDTRNVLKFTKKRSIIFWHDFKDSDAEDIIEVKKALDSLCYSERLKIFHIHKTWLAFTIISPGLMTP